MHVCVCVCMHVSYLKVHCELLVCVSHVSVRACEHVCVCACMHVSCLKVHCELLVCVTCECVCM